MCQCILWSHSNLRQLPALEMHDKASVGYFRQDPKYNPTQEDTEMNFWKSLAGMLCIRITSADPEKMLDTLISKDIGLQNIEQLDLLTFQCRIQRSDWRQVKYICKKAGCMVSIIRKEGIYWRKDHIIKRPVLLLWFLCFLIVVGILPTRVFFFQVAVNVTIPERKPGFFEKIWKY